MLRVRSPTPLLRCLACSLAFYEQPHPERGSNYGNTLESSGGPERATHQNLNLSRI